MVSRKWKTKNLLIGLHEGIYKAKRENLEIIRNTYSNDLIWFSRIKPGSLLNLDYNLRWLQKSNWARSIFKYWVVLWYYNINRGILSIKMYKKTEIICVHSFKMIKINLNKISASILWRINNVYI